MASARDEALKIIESLPETASWEDLMYQLYVKQKLNEGLAAAKEGRVLSHQEVRRKTVSKH
jgi:predicted transcriptional regulator